MDVKRIEKKLKSYIKQDKNNVDIHPHHKLDYDVLPSNYIDVNDVEILLKIQDGKCYICKENVIINYKPGCKNQFSLDRINGRKPHFKGNVLIACWYCNCRGYNCQPNCKYNCCRDKSPDLRAKFEVKDKEVNQIIEEYNRSIQICKD